LLTRKRGSTLRCIKSLKIDGNHLASKPLAKRIEENEASWNKTQDIKHMITSIYITLNSNLEQITWIKRIDMIEQ